MADLDSAFDEQDQSEIFDEDNTNPQERGPGEEAEQFEDLVELMDVTSAEGDADDDEALIGDDLDDDEIVSITSDNDDGEDDLEDDELAAREERSFDDPDSISVRSGDEVELEYVGDLNDLEGAASAAQGLESDNLSDSDLRELDYKDEFTIDEDGGASPAP